MLSHSMPAAEPEPRSPAQARELARARTVANVLDRAYLDPILGFVVPGLGDLLGSGMGMYIVVTALRLRVPPVVIARMLMNLATDAALGIVPLAGDVADVAFRAHRKNLALLVDRGEHRGSRPSDWLLVLGALALLVAILVAVVWVAGRVWSAVFG